MDHSQNADPPLSASKTKSAGLIVAGIFGGLAAGIVAIAVPFVVPAFRKVVLPYVPATPIQIENVLQALRYKKPDIVQICQTAETKYRLIDLGSGDGRIVIECAKQGIRAHGVELNPWLVLYSKCRAYLDGVHNLASFQRKNLFKIDLANYEQIVVFGVDSMMPLIEEKVQKDCDRSNKRVTLIACRFPLPNWQPFVTFGSGIDQVWLYKYSPSSLVSGE